MTIDPQKAVDTLQKRYKKQNEYIKNSYDRISVTLPKGTKERIKAKTPQPVITYAPGYKP